jgi:hypothetical protein
MARFATSQGSLADAINVLADKADSNAFRTVGALGAVATITLSAAQSENAVLTTAGGSTITITTATAAAIIALIPDCQVGYSYEVIVVNGNSGTATMAAGAGVTLAGATTVATGTNRIFRGIVTNVATPAITLYGI